MPDRKIAVHFRYSRRGAAWAWPTAASCLLLAAGAAPAPSLIVLQDPASGRIVPCGPPPNAPSADPAADAARCAAAFERQGYRPLPIEDQ
jgi:hypothetical protein